MAGAKQVPVNSKVLKIIAALVMVAVDNKDLQLGRQLKKIIILISESHGMGITEFLELFRKEIGIKYAAECMNNLGEENRDAAAGLQEMVSEYKLLRRR